MKKTPEQRFLEMVEKTDTCWLWKGTLDKDGYGKFNIFYRQVMAHRWIFEKLKSEIPPGLVIDHLCSVRNCVRLDHLEPVTPKQNVMRSKGLAVINSKKTHCPKGHEYTLENTFLTKSSERVCLECNKLRCLLRRLKKNPSLKRRPRATSPCV